MAQITLDNSNTNNGWAINGSPRVQVWYDSTTVYQFFCTNASIAQVGAFYRKSTDSGATWAARVQLLSINAGYIDFDVYYARWHDTSNTPIAHVVVHDDTGVNRGIYYQNVNLATEALDTPTGTHIGNYNPQPNSGSLSIGMSASERLHVVALKGVFDGDDHLISTNGGLSFAASSDTDFGLDNNDMTQMWPDASSADPNDVLAFWLDIDTSAFKVVQWDDSAGLWLSPATINSAITRSFSYNNWSTAYRRSDGHVFVLAFATDGSPNTLKCWDVFGTGSITARTNVLTSIANSNACALQVDTEGHLYAFYARGGGGLARVYYKISTDSGMTWGDEQLYSSVDEDVMAILSDPSPNVAKAIPAYYSYSDTDLYIEGIAIPTDSTPTAPPLVFKCMDGVDGVGVITFIADGIDVFRCIDVDGVAVVSFTTDSYPLLRGA